jgi:hypothetical protein
MNMGPGNVNFRAFTPPVNSLVPNGTTTFTVTYRPLSSGDQNAMLDMPTNDPDQSIFHLVIHGTGGIPLTTWRQQHFGDTANTGDAADFATPAHDGITNLNKFAAGLDPHAVSGDGTSLTSPVAAAGFALDSFSTTNPSPSQPIGDGFRFFYRRNKLALAQLAFQVEWSDSLETTDWHTSDITEEVLSDDGSIQQVQATVPVGTAGQRFVRLKLTKP